MAADYARPSLYGGPASGGGRGSGRSAAVPASHSASAARHGGRASGGASRSRHAASAARNGAPRPRGGFAGRLYDAIAGAFSSLFGASRGMRSHVVAALAVCLVLSGALLYPGAKDYYTAVRDQAKAQAEYAALQDYYQKLQDEVAYLSTDEGVEDAARAKYGWVYPNENSVLVQGVQSESDFDGTGIGIVPAGSVHAPDTWYSGILDPFFGYTG